MKGLGIRQNCCKPDGMKCLVAALLLAAPVGAQDVTYQTLEMRGHWQAPGMQLVQIANKAPKHKKVKRSTKPKARLLGDIRIA